MLQNITKLLQNCYESGRPSGEVSRQARYPHTPTDARPCTRVYTRAGELEAASCAITRAMRAGSSISVVDENGILVQDSFGSREQAEAYCREWNEYWRISCGRPVAHVVER